MLINQTLGTQFQRSRRSSDSSSSSSSESSSSDDEERESKRSKSRSRRSKKEKKRRSRSKHSSSESEEADGPLPLSRFFGSVKSWSLLNGYNSTSKCTMLFSPLLISVYKLNLVQSFATLYLEHGINRIKSKRTTL